MTPLSLTTARLICPLVMSSLMMRMVQNQILYPISFTGGAPPVFWCKRLREGGNNLKITGLYDGVRNGVYLGHLLGTNSSSITCTLGPKQPPLSALPCCKYCSYHQPIEDKHIEWNALMLNGLHWNPESLHAFSLSPLIQFVIVAASESGPSDSLASYSCSWLHPLFLQAKTAANLEDNPNWWQEMSRPFHKEF